MVSIKRTMPYTLRFVVSINNAAKRHSYKLFIIIFKPGTAAFIADPAAKTHSAHFRIYLYLFASTACAKNRKVLCIISGLIVRIGECMQIPDASFVSERPVPKEFSQLHLPDILH